MDYNANINRLRYFQTVCKYSNITKAAGELNISQPSITMAIKELEEDLDVLLFNRNNNRLFLTDEGNFLLAKTNDLLREVDLFYKEISDIGGHSNPKVKLCIPPIIGTVLIPKIYAAVSRKYPDLLLEIFESTLTDALSLLDNNIVDIAILLYDNLPEKYEHKSFYETEIRFCINNRHPFAQKQVISCQDLENFPLAVLGSGSFHHMVVIKMFEREKVTPRIVVRSQELKTITELIENYDMGTFTYRDIFQNNENIKVIECKTSIPVILSAVWNKNNYTSKSMEKIIRLLAAQDWL
ncbi:MAG TPA: LysR family transcriptional regulator [Bacillota bacterium]|nr:LysR family transcriptional regulator [Bacillota bacterium]